MGTGSFGIPEDMMQAIHESKEKGKTKKSPRIKKETPQEDSIYDSESIPETDEEETEEETNSEAPLNERISQAKKELGISISEDDLYPVLMGQQFKKSGVVIFPGKLTVTFTTLSVNDSEKMDAALYASLKEKELLDSGFNTLKTKYLLANGILSIGKPGKEKNLGKTVEDRFDQIGKMSTLLVERLAQKWNQFTWLTNVLIDKEMDLGKS